MEGSLQVNNELIFVSERYMTGLLHQIFTTELWREQYYLRCSRGETEVREVKLPAKVHTAMVICHRESISFLLTVFPPYCASLLDFRRLNNIIFTVRIMFRIDPALAPAKDDGIWDRVAILAICQRHRAPHSIGKVWLSHVWVGSWELNCETFGPDSNLLPRVERSWSRWGAPSLP